MELDARTKAKIAFLNEEMDVIHYANNLYWQHGTYHSNAARTECEFTNERLEKIREELARLRSGLNLPEA